MKRLIFLTMALMTCPLSLPATARLIFVDDSASGANDGSNWANAFNYLQDALDIAESGDEIRVAQGTYWPDRGDNVSTGDRAAAFNMKAGVTIKGGYAGFGAPDPDARDCEVCRTILSGDLAGNDVEVTFAGELLNEPTRADNSYSILYVGQHVTDPAPVIEGFTIKGASDRALNMVQSDIIVTDCVFQANAAEDSSGGAVYFNNSRALFTRCSFLDNAAGENGGAVYSDGCGTCRSMYAAFVDCIFMGNYAFSYGGAVCSRSTTLTTAINCLFIGNTANGFGAALYEDSYTYGNQLGSHLVNCTFAGNNCIAVYVTQYGFASLTSCILWDNLCGTNGGLVAQISCKMPGTAQGSANINYCCIQGWDGSLGGAGNFPDNPKFVSPGVWDPYREYTPGDDYRLKSDSPCINAGDPSFVAAPTNPSIPSIYYFPGEDMGPYILRSSEQDLDGQDRVFNGRVDMGPYERFDTEPSVIYVDDSATGANNGSSWANAYRYLQDALEAAANGFEIRVAQGTYKPDQGDEVSTGDREATFHMEGDLTIRGGYAGFGQPDPDARDFNRYETILSGDLAGNDAEIADARDLLTHATRTDNSSHVVTVSGSYGEEVPTIEGFTITGGNAGEYGGGLYVDYDDAIITDCTFVNNSAGYGGGAMAFRNGRTIFTRCSFINNAAAENGGAVHQDGCSTCRSMYGAFIDCAFLNNYAGMYGGGVYTSSYTLTTAINCLFVGNTALDKGGAIHDDSYRLGVHLVNCTLSGNKNVALYTGTYSPATLTNCVLWNNLDGENAGRTAQICWEDTPAAVNYTCLQGLDGSVGGVGNLADDPQFVSPGSWDIDLNYTPGNYHLQPNSPCVNAGDPNYVATPTGIEIPTGYYWPDYLDPDDYVAKSSETDLDAMPRVVQGRVDMGPYEWHIAALIAHWKLDESEGDTAEDSAGNNDGVLHGDPQWQSEAGRINGALAFDGDGDYVNCSNSEAFDITVQITVAAWVRINAVNMDWQTVIAKGDSAWRLSTAEDEYRYCFAVTGGPPWNYISGDTVVAANEWHHVCGTYDGADLRLYIDGAEDPAGPVPEAAGVTTDEYDVLIGENQERPGRYWDGMIDDVRIYNYALNSTEVAQLFSPTVIYVDADAPGANNGCCWGDAFQCLQDALAAATEGAEIRVAQGTYRPDCGDGITPGDRTASFQLRNAVAIKGGYAGHGQPEPDAHNISEYPTVLSGDLLGNDTEVSELENWEDNEARSDNSYHVVTAMHTSSTAVLDGFTISGGYADATSPRFYGAGMYIYQSSPNVVNCVFTDNWALNYGAGMCIDSNSTPTVADCTFTANASTDGAGADNEYSNPTFIRCTFTGNIAYEFNADSYGGAGMYNYHSNPTLTNCIFAGNIAPGWGTCGALQNNQSSPTLLNCTFYGNHAEGWAGGIYNGYESFPELTNCILWGNTNGEIHEEFAQISGNPATVNFCCVEGWTGDLGGLGNIGADPRFVRPGYWGGDDSWVDGDYHLKSFGWRWDAARDEWTFDRVTSRCIDAGNPGSPLLDEPLAVPSDPDNDYGHNLRINMGAYGGTAEASMPPYDWALLADINNDGIVDFYDFACAGPDWLCSAPQQPCDLDRDGAVGPPDLDLFADDWLKTTLWWE